jgi:hypothetical protein
MSAWIQILVAIFESPLVQQMLKDLWAWLLQRLEARFGKPSVATKEMFVEDLQNMLSQTDGEFYWWQFGRKILARRMAAHALTRTNDIWN